MNTPFYRKLLRIIALSFLMLAITGVLFAGLFPWFYKQLDHRPWAVNYSPDRRFRMEYHAIPFLPFRPHYLYSLGIWGSDSPGYVRLVDNTNGDILWEKYFSSGHQVTSGIDWGKNMVSVNRFVTWRLPRR